MRRQTCLTAAQQNHGVCGGHVFQRIERYLDLPWPPLRLDDPQRQTDADQRMANGRDDRLQMIQDILRHVLVAVAESLDDRRRRRLGTIGKAVSRVSDLQDVAFDFDPTDVSQPLLCQPGARCLHYQTGIERAAFAGFEIEIAHTQPHLCAQGRTRKVARSGIASMSPPPPIVSRPNPPSWAKTFWKMLLAESIAKRRS